MPADRLLGTLLRSLQTYTDQQDTPRLLGTASYLLTTLNNPLNVTLLTSQLLSSPAIWFVPEGLRTCIQCLSVFHSAAKAFDRQEEHADTEFEKIQLEHALPKIDWITAVAKGADENSPRWRHVLVFGGLLLGFGPIEDEGLPGHMRSALGSALTTAANLSLAEAVDDEELGQEAVVAVLNHCFPMLSDYQRDRIDYDLLLPALMRATLHSTEGLQSGYFLGTIDLDVVPSTKTHFNWSQSSSSFKQMQSMMASPLISSLGPLARLIGHSIEQVKQIGLVTSAVEDLEGFSRTLHNQWRQSKLSEIDPSEESVYLDEETLQRTTPLLWKLLKSATFAAVIVLRSALGRAVSDPGLAKDSTARTVAAQALYTLRNLYFVSSRLGATSFSQYNFVNLAAIDVLTKYPAHAQSFLQSIKPANMGRVPKRPLERNLDLFFLNNGEHFTLVLPAQVTEELLVAAATPYLAAGGNNNLLPIFEAAHSVMLAALSAPQNATQASKHLPFYIDALFKAFPGNLSARQFRMAFKTLLRITVPPSVLARDQPLLPAILLELLHTRAGQATTIPLTPQPNSVNSEAAEESSPYLSEQAVLTLTVLDTFTELPLELLDEWLPLTAAMIHRIEDGGMREHCKEHFWHVLVDGELDPDRSQICHAWWTTNGGKEMVLFGGDENGHREETIMSGALPSEDGRESKL